MTRQEAVIKISRINRIIGEWKYLADVNKVWDYEILMNDLKQISGWAKEISQYLKQNYSPQLIPYIANFGYYDTLIESIKDHKEEIQIPYVDTLSNFATQMSALMSLCNDRTTDSGDEFSDLTKELANKRVAKLLRRAVKAKILDEHFRPLPRTRIIQLKAIAYAVSNICGFRHPYIYFERLWYPGSEIRISTCRVPRYRNNFYKKIISLYPEVDFSAFEPAHDRECFYTPQDDTDKELLYKNLVEFGYISPDTTLDIFEGIFDKVKFVQPVNWVKSQRQLAYFIYTAFSGYNKKHLWIKGESCFLVNGELPHKMSLQSGYCSIKRAGWLNCYDAKLKTICNTFNHIKPQTSENECGRIIKASKRVFFSSRGDKALREMYSELHTGEYIATETTLSDFEGIFDEMKFKGPIVWQKSQAQLMYFVRLAFKEDNPYDLWKKCALCFCLTDNGTPNHRSMDSYFNCIEKRGKKNTYNAELKAIADRYIGSADFDEKAPELSQNSEGRDLNKSLIHI